MSHLEQSRVLDPGPDRTQKPKAIDDDEQALRRLVLASPQVLEAAHSRIGPVMFRICRYGIHRWIPRGCVQRFISTLSHSDRANREPLAAWPLIQSPRQRGRAALAAP